VGETGLPSGAWFRLDCARIAQAAEQNIVAFQGITLRRQVFYSLRASMDLKQPVARPAEKMVVMTFRRQFPAGRLAGQIYLYNLSRRLERLQIAVHGGDSQARDFTVRHFIYFVHRQGPSGVYQCLADGIPLLSLSFHRAPLWLMITDYRLF